MRLGETILAIRRWAATLATPPAAIPAAPSEAFTAAYMAACKGRAPDHNEIGLHYFRAGATLAQPAPVQQEAAGLPRSQEPKYTVTGSHIVNRASGEAIPHDEPIFIFRARDKLAVRALLDYAARCTDNHYAAVRKRVKDFRAFASRHPDRMKKPDTAALQPTQGAGGA